MILRAMRQTVTFDSLPPVLQQLIIRVPVAGFIWHCLEDQSTAAGSGGDRATVVVEEIAAAVDHSRPGDGAATSQPSAGGLPGTGASAVFTPATTSSSAAAIVSSSSLSSSSP